MHVVVVVTLLILAVLDLIISVGAKLYPCSSIEAEKDGDFSCLRGCNDDSIYDGYQYCMNYLPNNGRCYLTPFDRSRILNCNGHFGREKLNHWIVMIGGSNMFYQVKSMLDEMLHLPAGTIYNPQMHFNATIGVGRDHEIPILDFLWNADGKVLRNVAESWKGRSKLVSDLFLDIPQSIANKGLFRLSHLNTHLAEDFKSRFNAVVLPGSAFLNTKPTIDVYFEWSGLWGDHTIGPDVHAANLQYLVDRQRNESLQIRSFVASDSGNDCIDRTITKKTVITAYQTVNTSFPKYYYSKRRMVKQQLDTSNLCMSHGHAWAPLNYVFHNRYFNMICPTRAVKQKKDEDISSEEIPACVSFNLNQSACFHYIDKQWHSNLHYTCSARYLNVSNFADNEYCPPSLNEKDSSLPECSAMNVEKDLGYESNKMILSTYGSFGNEEREGLMLVTISLVYIGALLCFIYVMYESWIEHLSIASKNDKNHKKKVEYHPEYTNAVTSNDQKTDDLSSEPLLSDVEAKAGINNGNVKGGQSTAVITAAFRSSSKLSLSAFLSFPAAEDNSSGRFESVSFARYIASVHIVLGHMYQSGRLSSFHSLNKFGFTWVPWFFMLSGFILTTSEAKRRAAIRKANPDAPLATAVPVGVYVFHRLESMYPTYLVGILVALGTAFVIKGPRSLPPANDVMLYLCLLQSWVPSVLEYGLLYLVQCWFMSCLLFYWCIFQKVHDMIEYFARDQDREGVVVLIAFSTSILLPLLYQIITYFFARDWHKAHTYLDTEKAVDVEVVSLKYHPLAYLHIFVLGCCLPHLRSMILRIREDTKSSLHRIVKLLLPYTALASYTALVVIFCTKGDAIPDYKLSFRLGLISAIQSSLLIGLSIGEDVVSRLFRHPFLSRWGQYSFPQYIFQFIVQAWFGFLTKQQSVDMTYFAMLFCTSVLVCHSLKHVNGKNMIKFVRILAPLVVTYLMLQPLWSAYRQSKAAVKFPTWWQDHELDVVVETPYRGPGLSSERFTFNPSILVVSHNKLHEYIVARRDHLVSTFYSWSDNVYFLQQRYSTDILIGYYNANLSAQVMHIASTNFKPCVSPFTCNRNGTLTAKITSQPEDPRLVLLNNEVFVTFFSYDNILSSLNSSQYAGKELSGTEGDYGTGSLMCTPDAYGLIGRMYIAKLHAVPASPCMLSEIYPIYQSSLKFPAYSVLKNWLAFAYPPIATKRRQNLFFIHQIAPKVIIFQADADISKLNRAVNTYVVYETETPQDILDIYAKAQQRYPKAQSDRAAAEISTNRKLNGRGDEKVIMRKKALHVSKVNTTALSHQSGGRIDQISHCQVGFSRASDGSCYLLHPVQGNFTFAVAACEKHGGWLASVYSKESNDLIMSLVHDSDLHGAYIGYRKSSGRFDWVHKSEDRKAMFSDWESGQPSAGLDCTAIRHNGQWISLDCLKPLHFICESPSFISPLPSLPSSPPTRISLADDMSANSLHGSVNPIYIAAKQSPYLGFGYYMSIFHTITVPGDSLHYAAFSFTFCAIPPFAINAVAPQQLLLETKLSTQADASRSCDVNMAFVSGLTVDDCLDRKNESCLVMSYGVCDRQSRVAYISLLEYERTLKVVRKC